MSLYTDEIIFYVENLKDSTQNFRTNKWIQQGGRIQNIQRSVAFLHTKNEVSEKVKKKKKKKKTSFKMALEITSQNKPNQGDEKPIC